MKFSILAGYKTEIFFSMIKHQTSRYSHANWKSTDKWSISVSKVSWKFRISTIYNFAVIYPWQLLFSWKVAVYKQNFTA